MSEPRSRAHLKYLEWWHSAGCVGQDAAGNWIAEIEAERDALAERVAELDAEKPWDDLGTKQVNLLSDRIQELEADNNSLEARVAALESALLWTMEEWFADFEGLPLGVKRSIVGRGDYADILNSIADKASTAPAAQRSAALKHLNAQIRSTPSETEVKSVNCDHFYYSLEKHGRRCYCGTIMETEANPGEVGKCECGASYYRVEDIGTQCDVQYCRGTIKATAPETKGDSNV